MVKTRGRRRVELPVRGSRKRGSSRQGQVKTPPRRSLRNEPSRTEKGSEYQSSQKQKKRKKELAVCRRSPLPSQKIDALSPTKPRYSNKTSKQTASAEKINVSSSPLRKLCLATNKGKERKGKGMIHTNNISDSEEEEHSKQIVNERDGGENKKESKDGNATSSKSMTPKTNEYDDDDRKNPKNQNESSKPSLTKFDFNDSRDNEDSNIEDMNGTLSDTKGCGIESISPKKSSALPGLFEGLGYFCFSVIDDNLSSGLLTYARKIETNSEVRFPFSYTCDTKQDRMSLRKNPEQHNASELHAGTSILDLASQWTFMHGQSKDNQSKSSIQKDWCSLPATTFYYMSRGDYDEGSELARILNINPDTRDLFSHKVIDLVIHHGAHFSRMFIMNARIVADDEFRFFTTDSHPCPCILHADSGTLHDTEKCAQRVRKFLNQYGKEKHDKMDRNLFNKNSLPAFKLKGKNCVSVYRLGKALMHRLAQKFISSSSPTRRRLVLWLSFTVFQVLPHEIY